jgi:putative transposase
MLALIQLTAEYDNEVAADLADAVTGGSRDRRRGSRALNSQVLKMKRDKPASFNLSLPSTGVAWDASGFEKCRSRGNDQERHRSRSYRADQFPSDEAATKLLWLALRNIMDGTIRSAKEWKMAMNQFAVLYGDRFTNPKN